MIALLRYEVAILLRSHRWVFPLIAYGALILTGAAGGAVSGPAWLSLADGLDWAAAMLIPVVAFLTRSMLTAEPDASRACVAAAAGPVLAQLAALLAALGGGVVLGLAGACFEVIANPSVSGHAGGLLGNVGAAVEHPVTLAVGLAMTALCLLVGSAVGALCNPPLLRHPATAMLATLAAAVFALASEVSPAGAALRHASSAQSPHWPSAPDLLAAACLVAVTWTASALVAARRESSSASA
ncbi:MAG TPA: hypothetical protein VHZ33_29755 [Trebonia sp.]|nr:hypothetical protein [Trebonia sp.]